MSSNHKSKRPGSPMGQPAPVLRPGFRLALSALVVLSLAAAGLYFMRHGVKPVPPASTAAATPDGSASKPDGLPETAQPLPAPIKETTQIAVAAKPARPSETAPATAAPEPNPQARQLIADLSNLELVGRTMTPEQVEGWKQNLQQLVKQGRDAVPAIAEFLKQNKDVDFGTSVSQALGYGSVRRAMFEALTQIGGPEGVAATRDVLHDSADPREIALLARALDKMAPEEHRQEAVQAARETLAMVSSGKLEGVDVGPLFEVLQKYGGAAIAPELEQWVNQWKYYGATALAQLPEGAGVPTLARLAQGTSSARLTALEMLAHLSIQYPDAKAALVDQVRANKITPSVWPYLVSGLAGDEYHYQNSEVDDTLSRARPDDVKTTHIRYGNQNLYSAPSAASLTPEVINQRMSFIDELKASTSDPAALQALQESREVLAKRLPRSVAVAP